MEDLWYADIMWYGNLLELVGAVVGILQYLGAERINNFAERFNIWNSENFVTLGPLKIPVDRSLASWANERKSILRVPLNNLKKYWRFYLTIPIIAIMVACFQNLIATIAYSNSWWPLLQVIIVVALILAVLPPILYIGILLLATAFLLISIVLQMLAYYSLSLVSFLLRLTAFKKQQLIAISVVIVILGLALQVVGPVFQSGTFNADRSLILRTLWRMK